MQELIADVEHLEQEYVVLFQQTTVTIRVCFSERTTVIRETEV